MVFLNIDLGVLFFIDQSMIEQAQTGFQNKMYIYFPREILVAKLIKHVFSRKLA